MRAPQIVVAVTGATAGVSAVLGLAAPGQLATYLATCTAVYATSGVVVAARRSPDSDPADLGESDSLCDACGKVPPIRTILVQDSPFAVCGACTPPVEVAPSPDHPFVPTVVP